MAYVFGNDYGNLYGNLLGTQQADASNWFRMSDLGRAQEGDQFNRMLAVSNLANQEAERARAAQQWNFQRQNAVAEMALRQAAERRAEQEMGLRAKESDWRMRQPNPTEERGAEMLFKSALEAADTGELTPEVTKTLPESHREFLNLHNERARKAISGQKSDLDAAADLLNEITSLEYQIKQSKEDMPGYISTRQPFGLLPGPKPGEGRYAQRERMMDVDLPEWQSRLEQLQKAAASIRPETRAHLRINERGWWEPNFRLPWATGPSGAMPPTGSPTAGPIAARAPVLENDPLGLGIRR